MICLNIIYENTMNQQKRLRVAITTCRNATTVQTHQKPICAKRMKKKNIAHYLLNRAATFIAEWRELIRFWHTRTHKSKKKLHLSYHCPIRWIDASYHSVKIWEPIPKQKQKQQQQQQKQQLPHTDQNERSFVHKIDKKNRSCVYYWLFVTSFLIKIGLNKFFVPKFFCTHHISRHEFFLSLSLLAFWSVLQRNKSQLLSVGKSWIQCLRTLRIKLNHEIYFARI